MKTYGKNIRAAISFMAVNAISQWDAEKILHWASYSYTDIVYL